jgi:ADP-L-glycero-D-manno-heptose 6-epimerase
MIVITGAAGFIGSCMASRLNQEGYVDLILVDNFAREDKKSNWSNLNYSEVVDRDNFFEWIQGKENQVQFILHIGARTDTTEKRIDILDSLNVEYSKKMWNLCTSQGIPLIYASSAATYGLGEFGFTENSEQMSALKPLNLYGKSKQDFDVWALKQEQQPFFWAGLKFFNVYGPNEYHKGRMASVVFHAVNQIKDSGELKLFKSHRPDFKDGEQKRDFIYVLDLVNVILFLMQERMHSGIYNLGSGTASTFNELAAAIFKSLEKPIQISFIDTPEDIRDKYQYYTCADMKKLENIGYLQPFTNLDEGVNDYIQNYLIQNKYY